MFLRSTIKYPIVPLVSALNSNTRLIHLSSWNCIRRKTAKHTELELEQQYHERETEDLSCNANPNVNFFGIDGDEGVIVIDSKNSGNVAEKSNTNRRTKEKFFRSSFGIIRQDADNEIRRHGQYDSVIDYSFPHKSTEFTEVSGNLRQIKSNIFNVVNNKARKRKQSDNDCQSIQEHSIQNSHLDIMYCNGDVKAEDYNPVIDSNSVQYLNRNIHYETNNFIETDDSKQRTLKCQDVSNYSNDNLESVKNDEIQEKHNGNLLVNDNEISYIDECFFEDEHKENKFIKQENTQLKHPKESYGLSSDLNLHHTISTVEKNQLSSQFNNTHTNYFEELYFSNLNNNENSNKNPNAINCTEDELSYLDQNYFEKVLANQNSVKNENYQQNIEASCELPSDNIIHDIVSHQNIAEDTFSKAGKIFFNNEDISCSENTKDCNYLVNEEMSLNKISTSIKESFQDQFISKYQVSKKPSNNTSKLNLLPVRSVENRPAFSEKNDISEIQHPLNKQDSEDHIFNSRKNNHVECVEKYNGSYIPESITNLNSKIKLRNISQENFHSGKFQTEFSEAEHTLNIPIKNHMQTAYDFITELREKQNLESKKDQKDARILKSTVEKLDSKGFRILKNQVPNLSHYTREEILDILKRSIIYSDENLIVMNKPYSLIIHDSQTTKSPCLSSFLDDLAKELDQHTAVPKLFTVHRLDKETTGCFLLARNEITAQNLKSLFAQRKIIKKYWITTIRVPNPLKGVIDIPISEGSINGKQRMVLHPNIPKDIGYKSHSKNGKRAVTSYRVLCISGNAALVEATPETGIKHQIRVHFGFGLSCPILGDHKYSHIDKLAPQKLASDLLQRLHVRQSKVRYIPMHIHSKSITIPNYFQDRDLFVMAPLPSHMISNLKKLKFKKKNQLTDE